MKPRVAALIVLSWMIAVGIAVAWPSRCGPPCEGSICHPIGCTEGLAGVVVGAVVGLAGTAFGVWLSRRKVVGEA